MFLNKNVAIKSKKTKLVKSAFIYILAVFVYSRR